MADTKISALPAVTDMLATDEFVLARSSVTNKITGLTLSNYLGARPYVLLQDRRAANTNGGSSTSGSWQTRTLQTEVVDDSGICSLAGNQFTLDAGDYLVQAWATIVGGAQSKNRIRNTTASTTLAVGSSEYSPTGAGVGSVNSVVEGTFTVAASQALEIQSRVAVSRATDGYGVAANFGEVEVYSSVALWKLL